MTWIKRQVVMLPTEKAENCLLQRYGRIRFSKGYFTQQYLNAWDAKSYHLYILSDEEIKEGDWVYRFDSKDVFKADSFLIHLIKRSSTEICKKIIATTDKSLGRKCTDNCTNYITESCNSLCDNSLPQPSQQFINKYIEEYNKGNIITEVMVEYGYTIIKSMGHFHQYRKYFLKTNSKDNTISIRKLKDSWNREEVIELFKNYWNDNICPTICATEFGHEEHNAWIEKNL